MSITLGILHPGAMGSAVGAAAAGTVVWAGTGRSAATAERAEAAGIEDAGSVEAVGRVADVIISLCPPSAAFEVATEVADSGYAGVYCDANAISPQSARRIGDLFDIFVDGGVIGPPPRATGTTRLYLSGDEAAVVAGLFEGSVLDTRVIEGGPGAASALKVSYAAWTKGSTALLLTVRALAEAEGVSEALISEWEESIPGLVDRLARCGRGVGPKAWRFAGEMEEIAAAFDAADLPAGFHLAAAEVYHRLSLLKGTDGASVEEVIRLLRGV